MSYILITEGFLLCICLYMNYTYFIHIQTKLQTVLYVVLPWKELVEPMLAQWDPSLEFLYLGSENSLRQSLCLYSPWNPVSPSLAFSSLPLFILAKMQTVQFESCLFEIQVSFPLKKKIYEWIKLTHRKRRGRKRKNKFLLFLQYICNDVYCNNYYNNSLCPWNPNFHLTLRPNAFSPFLKWS